MRRFTFLFFTLLCVAGLSCGRGNEPIPNDGLGQSFPVSRVVRDLTPKPSDPALVVQGEPFLFRWQPMALTAPKIDLQVNGQGQVTYTVVVPQLNTSPGGQAAPVVFLEKQACFTLTADTTQELRKLLATGGFLDLESEYHTDVADGLVVEAELTVGNYRKSVFCNNYFPRELRMISRFINERILAPHQEDVDSAKTVAAPSSGLPSD